MAILTALIIFDVAVVLVLKTRESASFVLYAVIIQVYIINDEYQLVLEPRNNPSLEEINSAFSG